MTKIRKEQQKSYIKYLGEMTQSSTSSASSTSYVDISTLSINMPDAGDLVVQGSLFLQDLSAGAGDDIFYYIDLDASAQNGGQGSLRTIGQYNGASCAVFARFTGLSAGNHTLKIKMASGTPHNIQWKSGLCHLGCYAHINI